MPKVEVHLTVYPSVPGVTTGPWHLRRTVELPQVPAPGDELVLSPSSASETVVRSHYHLDGRVVVVLQPIKTDSEEILEELQTIAAEGGWTGAP
jgi:hypothetical protein